MDQDWLNQLPMLPIFGTIERAYGFSSSSHPTPQKKEQLHSMVPKWFHLRPSWFRLGLFFQTNMGERDQYCGMSIELPQNGSIFQLQGPKVQPGNKHPMNGIPFAIIGHHIVVRNRQEMYIQQTSHQYPLNGLVYSIAHCSQNRETRKINIIKSSPSLS